MPVESFTVQDRDEQNGWACVLSHVSGLAPRWRAVAPLCISALGQNYVRLLFKLVQRLLCYLVDMIKRKKICLSVSLWTDRFYSLWGGILTAQILKAEVHIPGLSLEQLCCFLLAVSL